MDANERRTRAGMEAAEWWAEMRAAEMPRARREAFVEWLRESPLHVSEMLHVVQVDDALTHFERWTRISTEGSAQDDTVLEFARPRSLAPTNLPESPVAPTLTGRGRRHRVWLAAGVAASSLLVVGLSVWLSLSGQIIETERGERREVALADGSVLQVDPQTRMRVKLREKTRRIELEQGRALFRVAKDPQRPFIVQANDTVARAVGTSFAVEHKSQDVVVTVAEGKVAVSVLPANARQAGPDLFAMLIANEQLTVDRSGSSASVRKVDSNRELAWTRGRLVFDDTPLAQVLSDFNRYNRVQLRIEDAALAARPVSGTFDASDPESFIAFIQTVAQVDVVRDDARNVTIAPAR